MTLCVGEPSINRQFRQQSMLNLNHLKSSGVGLALLLTACGVEAFCLPGQEQTVGTYVLFKSSPWDSSEKQQIAIIHGWADDKIACDEIVETLHRTEPNRYQCIQVDDFCLKDHSFHE